MKKIKNSLLCCLLLFTLNHCASTAQSNLEDARFSLDQGDYQAAIDAATKAIAADSSLVEAYRLLGDAQFGLSGVDLLDIEKEVVDLSGADTGFAAVAAILPVFTTTTDSDAALAHISDAIATLESTPGIDVTDVTNDTQLAAAAFDLAVMLTVDQYSIGVYKSGFSSSSDTLTVSGITDADTATAKVDLTKFDNYFNSSGVTKTFIDSVRQVFWMLEDFPANSGFKTAVFQAFVGCELKPDTFAPATEVPTAGVATCADLNPDNQATSTQDKYDQDTTE